MPFEPSEKDIGCANPLVKSKLEALLNEN